MSTERIVEARRAYLKAVTLRGQADLSLERSKIINLYDKASRARWERNYRDANARVEECRREFRAAVREVFEKTLPSEVKEAEEISRETGMETEVVGGSTIQGVSANGERVNIVESRRIAIR